MTYSQFWSHDLTLFNA